MVPMTQPADCCRTCPFRLPSRTRCSRPVPRRSPPRSPDFPVVRRPRRTVRAPAWPAHIEAFDRCISRISARLLQCVALVVTEGRPSHIDVDVEFSNRRMGNGEAGCLTWRIRPCQNQNLGSSELWECGHCDFERKVKRHAQTVRHVSCDAPGQQWAAKKDHTSCWWRAITLIRSQFQHLICIFIL